MLPEMIAKFFTTPVHLLGREFSRAVWLGLVALSVPVITAYFYSIFFLLDNLRLEGDPGVIVAAGFLLLGALATVLALYVLLRVIMPGARSFVILTLIVSAAAFFVDKYLLEHQIFAPFTERTVWALWISFIALGLTLFYRRLPTRVLPVLPAVLVFGLCVCIAFILLMAPMMAIGWIAIPFGGIGFLPYSPLMAAAAFGLMARQVDQEIKERRDAVLAEKKSETFLEDSAARDATDREADHATDSRAFIDPERLPRLPLLIARGLVIATLTALLVYVAWFARQWYLAGATIKAYNENSLQTGLVRRGLPDWTRLAMMLPSNHVVELFLHPTSSRGMSVFETGNIFDPLAFLISVGSSATDLPDEDRVHLLRLLFDHSHVGLERLWGGDTLLTTDVKSHVQLYPEARLSYTETTLSIYNEGTRQQEAIYTLTVPEGSVATKLSLWIGGVEEPARIAMKSTAAKAYREIVGVEARDPSLLTWMDGGRLRLRVFPVMGENYRTVRVGIISPLRETSDGRLHYQGMHLEGPPIDHASHQVRVDSFGKAAGELESVGVGLSSQAVSDGAAERWENGGLSNPLARAGGEWGFTIRAPARLEAEFRFGNRRFRLAETQLRKQDNKVSRIYLVMTDSLPRSKWREMYDTLNFSLDPNTRIHLVGTRMLTTTDPARAHEFIAGTPLPRFNPFPFAKIPQQEWALIVYAGKGLSVPLGDYKGSDYYHETQRFFAARRLPILVASMDGEHSAFFRGLAEFDRLHLVDVHPDDIEYVKGDGFIGLPINDSKHVHLPAMNASLIVEDITDPRDALPAAFESSMRGNDLLMRLYLYRRVMHKLGARYFKDDRVHADLLPLARDAMAVTPISSLIVLETEGDYKRFGIEKGDSALGQTQIKPAGSGSLGSVGGVPEPEEWALIILVLSALAYFYRDRLQTFLALLRARLGAGVF